MALFGAASRAVTQKPVSALSRPEHQAPRGVNNQTARNEIEMPKHHFWEHTSSRTTQDELCIGYATNWFGLHTLTLVRSCFVRETGTRCDVVLVCYVQCTEVFPVSPPRFWNTSTRLSLPEHSETHSFHWSLLFRINMWTRDKKPSRHCH